VSKTTCAVAGCDRPICARGWCAPHWQRWYNTGDVQAGKPLRRKPRVTGSPAAPCSVDGCGRPSTSRGWCKSHHARWRRHGDVQADVPIHEPLKVDACIVDRCDRDVLSRGYCRPHYWRQHRHGDVFAHVPFKGANHSGQCSESGCNERPAGRGMCMPHYRRWYRANMAGLRPEATPQQLAERAEATRAYNSAWKAAEYRANPEKVKARADAWKAANPDRARLIDAKKHRRRRQAPTIRFTIDQLAAKLAYWGGRCWICGGPQEAVDHVKPLGAGGSHILANLRPICTSCNSRKRDKWPYPTSTRRRKAV
jgi:hypothetical protein